MSKQLVHVPIRSMISPEEERFETPPDRSTVRVPEALSKVPVRVVEVSAESRLVVQSSPHSPGTDRFRYLRHLLRQERRSRKLKTIVVTSPLPQDGKSTVAANLATSLAERGTKSVLCVEADLYHPTIAQTLSLDVPAGYSECLSEDLNPLSAVTRLNPLGWYLMTAGRTNAIPGDLINAESVTKLIGKLEEHFDWIVFDTPPLLPLSDTVLLSSLTDGTLLIVRAGRTPQESVEESLHLIGQRHALGIVLNASDESSKAYHKYYGSYYAKE